jgi:hypothetical protein
MGNTLKDLLAVFLILATGFVSGTLILDRAFPKPLPPCGTGQPLDHCAPQSHPDNERWDQGYLDEFNARRPCPAVFDAPKGELRECL